MTILAVIGSRSFDDEPRMQHVLTSLISELGITTVVSGGARGADAMAANIAHALGLTVEIFKPDWKQYGRGAGPIRNKLLVDAADVVLAFWDGQSPGTKHAISYAKSTNKRVIRG